MKLAPLWLAAGFVLGGITMGIASAQDNCFAPYTNTYYQPTPVPPSGCARSAVEWLTGGYTGPYHVC